MIFSFFLPKNILFRRQPSYNKSNQADKEEQTLLQPETIKHHLLQYKFYYLGIFVLFLSGFLVGAFYSNGVSQEEFAIARETAEAFIESSKKSTPEFGLIFGEDFAPCLTLSFTGLILFGGIGTVYFLFRTGFSAGFFLSFLIKAFQMKGFFLSSLYLCCQLLFLLPAITVISFRALHLNLFFLSCTLRRASPRQSLKSELFLLFAALLAGSVAVALSTLTKCWLLPPLCRYLFA